jgi:hypothetical protein
MADRTWVCLHCRPSDLELVQDKTEMEPEFEGEEIAGAHVRLFEGEMVADLTVLPRNITFIYSHGSGMQFGAYEGVCDGKRFSEVPMADNSGIPGCYAIAWSHRRRDLKALERHMKIKARVMVLLGLKQEDLEL